MHILFLSDNFPPEVNAPASRTFEHTREWVKAGHRVTVITCAPNFPKGKVFDGYRNRIWQIEVIEGVRVIRVWTYITQNEGFLLRIIDYISFMISSTIGSLFVTNVDVVIGTSPQFFTACAAYIVSGLKRTPFVFELRDLWPESIKAVGAITNPIIIDGLACLARYLYRSADAIVAVTHSFKRYLTELGIPSDKVCVITNGADTSRFTPIVKDRVLLETMGLEDCFICGYIGTHGMAHGLETLLDAAVLLMNGGCSDVRILFLGDGAQKSALKKEAERRRIDNVLFLDTVKKEDVSRYWSILDLSIIHLRPNKIFLDVIPSKMFESIAMGIPLLHGVPGESAEIVEKEKVGIVFPSGDSQALYQAITRLKHNKDGLVRYQQRCITTAKKYSRLRLAGDFLSILEGLPHINKARKGRL